MSTTTTVSCTESILVNQRKQRLHVVQYAPVERPIANLVWHHGLGEHVGRYKKVFTKFAECGIAVSSYDAYGHGQSDPQDKCDRAVVWSFNDLVNDLYFVWDWAKKQTPANAALPTFIGGQSMGGLVAAHTALRSQGSWAGCLLHSAAIDVEWTPVLRAQAPISGVLSRLIPRARIVPAVRPQDMSQDPAVVQDYITDPLNTVGPAAVRTGAQILAAFRDLAPKYKELQLPLYAAHGTLDHCTSLPAVRRLMQAASSHDKTLVEVPGGYHELLKGPEAGECVARIVQWVTTRATPRSKL